MSTVGEPWKSTRRASASVADLAQFDGGSRAAEAIQCPVQALVRQAPMRASREVLDGDSAGHYRAR